MLVNRLYYLLKPLMPWRLRLALRRWRAERRRRNSRKFGQSILKRGESLTDGPVGPTANGSLSSSLMMLKAAKDCRVLSAL